MATLQAKENARSAESIGSKKHPKIQVPMIAAERTNLEECHRARKKETLISLDGKKPKEERSSCDASEKWPIKLPRSKPSRNGIEIKGIRIEELVKNFAEGKDVRGLIEN